MQTPLKVLKMNVLTFSEARASFKQTMDYVCRDHVPTVVTRQRGEHVVMISLDDFNSIQETLYLFSSLQNAKRLMESIDQLKANKLTILELDHESEDEDEEQDGC